MWPFDFWVLRPGARQSPCQASRALSRYQRCCCNNVQAPRREWAAESVAKNPDFFSKWANTQAPEYLFIGCADSRVPVGQQFLSSVKDCTQLCMCQSPLLPCPHP